MLEIHLKSTNMKNVANLLEIIQVILFILFIYYFNLAFNYGPIQFCKTFYIIINTKQFTCFANGQVNDLPKMK